MAETNLGQSECLRRMQSFVHLMARGVWNLVLSYKPIAISEFLQEDFSFR